MKETLLVDKIDWKKVDGLVPAIVQDHLTNKVLMLGFMNRESLDATLTSRHVTFFSRTKGRLWTKGETSGNFLNLVSLQLDCDGDTLLIRANPIGPTCHRGTTTCFDSALEEKTMPHTSLSFLEELAGVIDERFASASDTSYVGKLIKSGPDRMAQKVGEEAVETVIASKNSDLSVFEGEAADLVFHLMVLLRAKGSSLAQVAEVLRERHEKAKVSRR